MVLVDYRGKDDKRFACISDRQSLIECIAWLKKQLEYMEKNNKSATTVIAFSDEDADR